jgi:hypothetical protein
MTCYWISNGILCQNSSDPQRFKSRGIWWICEWHHWCGPLFYRTLKDCYEGNDVDGGKVHASIWDDMPPDPRDAKPKAKPTRYKKISIRRIAKKRVKRDILTALVASYRWKFDLNCTGSFVMPQIDIPAGSSGGSEISMVGAAKAVGMTDCQLQTTSIP